MEAAGQAFWERLSFARLSVSCRALSAGYLSGRPERKLRAIIKAQVQAASPCADQRVMDCASCVLGADCLFRTLFVPDPRKDYLPYFLFAEEPARWRGEVSPGSDRRFSVALVGRAAALLPGVADAFRRKPLFALDSESGAPIRFLFAEGAAQNQGLAVTAREVLDRHLAAFPQGAAVLGLSVEFTSPFCYTKGNRTLTRPELVDFGVFSQALSRRLAGLARDHCGFLGDAPEPTGPGVAAIGTQRARDFRFVREEAFKRDRGGRVKSELLGGFLGGITFTGDFGDWLPQAVLGEAFGIGNDTTQGSGRYRITGVW